MSKVISLLNRWNGKVEIVPFPHIVIENALPEHYYLELLQSRPSYDFILSGREPGCNKRVDLSAIQLLQKGVPLIWDDFIKYHISKEWWNEVYEVFGRHIDLCYPGLRLSGLMSDPGIRGATDSPFFLDCNVGINTPTNGESSVRGPHLDNPVELFAGLLYMGEGEGGDLVINKIIKPPKFYGKLEIHENCIQPIKTVKYKHNMFVMFLNTPLSCHSVTNRSSDEPRWLVNVIGEFSFPLFKVKR